MLLELKLHLQCQLLSHGISDEQDPRAAGLAAGALNWQLLLQVDSDDAAGMRCVVAPTIMRNADDAAALARVALDAAGSPS